MRTALEQAECAVVLVLHGLARLLPMLLVEPITKLLGDGAYLILRKRRRIALGNARHALGGLTEGRVAGTARESFRSFLLTAMPEAAKVRPHLTSPDARGWLRRRAPELEAMFQRAKGLHEESRGCIFVTPHLGNWELLPDVAAAVGIPLAVVVRPLDNPYLERLLLGSRRANGQIFVAKRNALLALQQHLASGRSVGMLPDQATYKGLPVPFLGRPALTTPVPALLALYQRRPIVVVACFRVGTLRFGGYVGEPIWPAPREGEKAEIARLTAEMNRAMEGIVRAHPEQYLWMHDRWKAPEALSGGAGGAC